MITVALLDSNRDPVVRATRDGWKPARDGAAERALANSLDVTHPLDGASVVLGVLSEQGEAAAEELGLTVLFENVPPPVAEGAEEIIY